MYLNLNETHLVDQIISEATQVSYFCAQRPFFPYVYLPTFLVNLANVHPTPLITPGLSSDGKKKKNRAKESREKRRKVISGECLSDR